MNKIISFVILCALLLMCFSGCGIFGDKNTESNENSVQSSNEVSDFTTNITELTDDGNSTDDINKNNDDYIIVESEINGDPASQYAIFAKIPQKCTLTEAHIPILLSYGLNISRSAKNSIEWDSYGYTDIGLVASNKDGYNVILNGFNIKEIINPEYDVEPIWDDDRKWLVGLDYSHTELCMLPLSLFFGDSGWTYINLYEYNSAEPDGSHGAGAGIGFYYTRYDTYISFSTEIQGS